MTTLATTPPPQRPEHLFTVEEYLRMVSAGILTKRDKVELIEGRIVEKMPIDPPPVISSELIVELLKRICPAPWLIRTDSPLQLEKSAPEPDIMVIRGPRENYLNHHPQATDVLLVIEISDSTLRDDRTEMARLYAGSGIPFYWIVNLRNRRVEVHSEPSGPDALPTYRRKHDIEENASVSLQFSEKSIELPVREMLPPATLG